MSRLQLPKLQIQFQSNDRFGSEAAIASASGELPESWLGTVGTALVVVPRHEVAAFPNEEIEVRALVRLQHVIEIKTPVAARERRLGLLPFPAPLPRLLLWHEQLQTPLGDVQLDEIAVFHQRERAARSGLGRDVQHHRSVGRAA